MDVSIVLVSYNTKDLTRNCIKSIYEKTKDLDYEIFVVDNNSKDGSPEMLKKEFPNIHLIQNSQNKGFGAANNIAIKESSGKYIFCLNTDTILVNNAIKILYDFMEQNPNAGACGGQLYKEDMTPQHSHGVFNNIKKIAFSSLGLCFLFPNFYKHKLCNQDHILNTKIKKVDYITGADLMLRRNILDTIGLFDEDFFMYCEESELQFRLMKKNYSSFIVPNAKIIHIEGAACKFPIERLRLMRDSELLFFRKCYGAHYSYSAKLLYIIRYLFSIQFNKNYIKLLSIMLKLKA